MLQFQTSIALWNAALATYVGTIPTLFPGSTVSLFDTHALFSTVRPDRRRTERHQIILTFLITDIRLAYILRLPPDDYLLR